MMDLTSAQRTGANQPMKLILIVEDDQDNAEVLSLLITQEFSCSVRHVCSGMEALHLLAEVKPYLIILDYLLPGMNGIEVADWLQAQPDLSCIPLLFVSASSNQQAIESRYVPFLEKPFERDTLNAHW